MKIIKFGDKVRQVTCPECGCIFEYDNHDEILKIDGYRIIECPDCLFEINIDKKTDK